LRKLLIVKLTWFILKTAYQGKLHLQPHIMKTC